MDGRILIVDGLNNFIRHYCVNPTLDNNGQPIGGIIGFLRMMKNILGEVRPSRVIIAWDGKGGSAKRRGVYSAYKAGRKPRLNREYGDDESVDDARANMQWQHRKLREYLDLLGCAQVEVEGCEADDVIGFLCSGFLSDRNKVVVSTDQDFLQLVDHKTIVYSPTRKMYFTSKNFLEEESVLPENFIYMKALNGDGSDNLKGIKGLGPKTILKFFPVLAEKKTSLEELNEMGKVLQPKGAKEKQILKALLEQWEVITQNFSLMQLRDPIISAQSVRFIKYAIRDEVFTFKFSDLKLQLIRDGVQLPDADLFLAFNEYKIRFQKEATTNVTE
jgi:DNA polymerase-1